MSQTLATTADAAQAVTGKSSVDITAFAGMFGGLLLVLLIIFFAGLSAETPESGQWHSFCDQNAGADTCGTEGTLGIG